MIMQPPPVAVMIGAATGEEYAHAHAHARHGSPSSVLGAELLDDSLMVSPEQYVLHKPGALNRD